MRANLTPRRLGVSIRLRLRRTLERLVLRGRSRAATPSIEPSFAAKLAERRRWLAAAADHGLELGTPTPLEDKARSKEVATRLGVRVVPTLVVAQPRELDLKSLPERFVAKPTIGAGSKGVLAMTRVADGRYRNDVEGVEYREAQLIEELERQSLSPCDAIVEEMLPGREGWALPFDWKFYTFDGEVGLVLQRAVRGHAGLPESRLRFYDANWQDLGKLRGSEDPDDTLPRPLDADALMATAVRLSRAVRTPFVRVDLYEAADGTPVFGELTATPGGPQRMRPDVDRRLGAMWEAAEVRLHAEEGTLPRWLAADA